MKKAVLPLVLILLCFIFTGCTENTELQNEFVIEAVGIDLDGKDVKLTVQALNTDNYQSGSDSSSDSSISSVYEVSGKSVNEALGNLILETGKTPIYSHNRIIILGKSVYEKNDISDYIDFFVRSSQSRDDLLIAASSDEAKNIAGAELGSGKLPAKLAEDIINNGERNGKCRAVHVYEFMNMYSNPCLCEYIPILKLKDAEKEEERKFEQAGTLITKRGKYAMTLSTEETVIFTMLTQGIYSGAIDEGINEQNFSLEVIHSKPKIKTDTSGKPSAAFELTCFCSPAEYGAHKNSMSKDVIKKLKDSSREKLQKEATELLNKTLTENGYDIYNLYSKYLKRETDYFKQNVETGDDEATAKKWADILKSIDITCDVSVYISRSGQDAYRISKK